MRPELTTKPPPSAISLPIIHKLSQLYQLIYQIGKQIGKRDRLGIHAEIERNALRALGLAIDAALRPKLSKLEPLQALRRTIETIKHLVRIEEELKIIKTETYWHAQQSLEEISKMATRWQQSLNTKEA